MARKVGRKMAEKETKQLKFKCPQCDCTTIEEVLYDVVQYSAISVIQKEVDGNGVYIDYDPKRVSHDGGEVSSYRCLDCQTHIDDLGEWDEPVMDEYALAEWIQDHCPQE